MIARIVLTAALLLTTPALAQEAPKSLEAIYDVPTATTLAGAKTRVMRVAFTDGYGQPAGLVSFLRAPGQEPRVEVGGGKAPMTAIISAATWRDLVEDSAGFDVVPAPPPPSEPGKVSELSLCMHAWGVTIETVDARGDIRRRSEGACQKGAAMRYGFVLAKAAIAALPACAALDAQRTRNAVTQLAECRMLSGDRAAAAEAYNIWNTPWFSNPRGPDFARSLAYLFFDFAEVTWPGEKSVKGNTEAAEAWVAGGEGRRFQPRRIIGETADRVRMEGVVWTRDVDGKRSTEIPATLVMTRENGFGFRVRSFKPD